MAEVGRRLHASGEVAAAPPDAGDALLYVDGVTVSFDGFKALDGLTFYAEARRMEAVIGPNGAGKTTLMDVITGKTRPDRGRLLFRGDIDLTRLDEPAIANLGIGRKFQKPTVFENHTAFDNLELAAAGDRHPLRSLFAKTPPERRDRIDETLVTVGLDGRGRVPAGALSHGQKQWLEIGMLLMQDPELLLVDEPAAGMTDAETETTAALLKRIAETHSVLVVEHDMDFIRALETRVTVMHEGRVLAQGDMDSVQNDERVIEVYLGR